ncbi:unnamed protein product, partial [Arabidopsis halleri]
AASPPLRAFAGGERGPPFFFFVFLSCSVCLDRLGTGFFGRLRSSSIEGEDDAEAVAAGERSRLDPSPGAWWECGAALSSAPVFPLPPWRF